MFESGPNKNEEIEGTLKDALENTEVEELAAEEITLSGGVEAAGKTVEGSEEGLDQAA